MIQYKDMNANTAFQIMQVSIDVGSIGFRISEIRMKKKTLAITQKTNRSFDKLSPINFRMY